MRCRSVVIGALTALTMSLLLPVTAEADSCPHGGLSPAGAPADSTPAPVPAGYPAGVLGPNTLPSGPVAKLLAGYNRLGKPPAADDKAFLTQYYKLNADGSGGDWIFPTNNGFDGAPELYMLPLGLQIDRFGSPYGQFLANAKDTPFEARGLPPSSLNTQSGNPEANYHIYCVTKSFQIQKGAIAKAIGQPGGGIQYFLGNTRVMDLIAAHDLVEVMPPR